MLNSAPPPVDFRRIRVAFMTASRFLVSLFAAWLVAGMASAASPTLDRIKASGTVTFGYRDGAAPFSAEPRNRQEARSFGRAVRKSRGCRRPCAQPPKPEDCLAAGRWRVANFRRRGSQDRCRMRNDHDHAVTHGARRLQRSHL